MKTLPSIFKQVASRGLTAAVALAFLGLGAQTASAHYFSITASSSCSGGSAVVTFTATSWDLSDSNGSNNDIAIYFNGTKVYDGVFSLGSPSPNTFSATLPAPFGAVSVTVTGVAIDNWVGDNFAAGATNPGNPANPATSGPIAIPTNCAPPPPPTGQGCTPGFYKNNADKKGASHWIGFTPSESLSAAGFTAPVDFPDNSDLPNVSLLSALSFGGGSSLGGAAEILVRAAVAAILNAENFGGSAGAIITSVNTALASDDRNTILTLGSTLDAANNGQCTLSNN